jgi:hypothetical protein
MSNKKFLLFIAIFVMAFSLPAFATTYTLPIATTFDTNGNVYDTFWQAQGFTFYINNSELASVDVRVSSAIDGSPVGMNVSIQADNSGNPSGTPLAYRFQPSSNITTNQYKTFEFYPPLTISSGTPYWIVVGDANTGGIPNYYHIDQNSTEAFVNGTAKYTSDSGSNWNTLANYANTMTLTFSFTEPPVPAPPAVQGITASILILFPILLAVGILAYLGLAIASGKAQNFGNIVTVTILAIILLTVVFVLVSGMV